MGSQMRSAPPPIQDVELRDQLIGLLRGALDDRSRAGPLYVLGAFGWLARERGASWIPRAALIEAAGCAAGEAGVELSYRAVLDELETAGLLTELTDDIAGGRVSAGTRLAPELAAGLARIAAYRRVVEAVHRRDGHAQIGVDRVIEQAAHLFREGLYFEVHEVLEAVWLNEQGPVRDFLQGVIQVAAGFHHLENRNLSGALSLLLGGTAKARRARPDRFGPEWEEFLARTEACRRAIESLGADAFNRFDRRMIPSMPCPGAAIDQAAAARD
jgi:hypothetical protein